jgi:hypothetical protein
MLGETRSLETRNPGFLRMNFLADIFSGEQEGMPVIALDGTHSD